MTFLSRVISRSVPNRGDISGGARFKLNMFFCGHQKSSFEVLKMEPRMPSIDKNFSIQLSSLDSSKTGVFNAPNLLITLFY